MLNTLIFDLDGTLIDSAPSILNSFAAALREANIEPAIPLVPEVIGPPLMHTLSLLSGSTDPTVLGRLADSFKAHYDTEGFKSTEVYTGVEAMLKQAKEAGYSLLIATNKRQVPTLKILQYLGWSDYFRAVYTLDTCDPSAKNKAGMITQLLREQSISIAEACYIGDRIEDGEAAEHNQLPFMMVAWGYFDGDVMQEALNSPDARVKTHWKVCPHPGDLVTIVKGWN